VIVKICGLTNPNNTHKFFLQYVKIYFIYMFVIVEVQLLRQLV